MTKERLGELFKKYQQVDIESDSKTSFSANSAYWEIGDDYILTITSDDKEAYYLPINRLKNIRFSKKIEGSK